MFVMPAPRLGLRAARKQKRQQRPDHPHIQHESRGSAWGFRDSLPHVGKNLSTAHSPDLTQRHIVPWGQTFWLLFLRAYLRCKSRPTTLSHHCQEL